MLKSRRSEGRRQRSDQIVKLAVVVLSQCCVHPISKRFWIRSRGFSYFTKVINSLMENGNKATATVIASFKHRIGEGHEPPQKIKRLDRVVLGHLRSYGFALLVQVFDQFLDLVPFNK